jgi:hypothetical protein
MKKYKSIITLSKNERGIWDLDTIKGCKTGIELNQKGCYGDCYAAKTAKRYGIDFSISVNREFINEAHRKQIVRQIEKIDMPFIRIGCSGDPSENWQHTLKIISEIRNEKQLLLFDLKSKKQIVIITRHWKTLTDSELNELAKYNVCVNTSVSALDSESLINNSLEQYNRLKPYCKSVLRIVSCDFNLENETGKNLAEIQNSLFKNTDVIDTIFRPSKSNYFVNNNIINTSKARFMKTQSLVSKFNRKTYLGKCAGCKEMCGINNLNANSNLPK